MRTHHISIFFFFNDTATTEIYTLSLHDALPILLSQEVRFANGNANLVGTIHLPANGDHLPAVVSLHGASNPTRLDALYRHLREGLPAIGIAVLIYDRRGSGVSSGSRADYETLADDAIAGKNALAKLPR